MLAHTVPIGHTVSSGQTTVFDATQPANTSTTIASRTRDADQSSSGSYSAT
jgi:hypothetical protein